MTFNRRKLTIRVETLGARFDVSGVAVAPDKRYDLVCDYLKASPSYRAVRDKLDGGKPEQLPSDHAVVAKVVRDFGDLRRIREADWWGKVGVRLYGITAPLPEVRLVGELREDSGALTAEFSGVGALVLEIPKALTLPQAIKQVRKALEPHAFSTAIPQKVAAKYVLMKSKLRTETLSLGIKALRLYANGMPLWQIGNGLRLIPAQAFDERALAKEDHHKVSYEKEVLSIAARRLVRTALLVAENAARGRFPSDKPFAEAMVGSYKRKAGRPTGSTSPKRRKAGA